MAKKLVKKISDKLIKVNDNLTVNILDNGYFVEIGGRDEDDIEEIIKDGMNLERTLFEEEEE